MLDKKLKQKLSNALKGNKKNFKEESLKLLNKSMNDDLFKPMLYYLLSKDYPEMFDEEYARKIIDRMLDDPDNPLFEDFFVFRLKDYEPFITDSFTNFAKEYQKIQNKSFNMFCLDEQHMNEFKKLNNFSCFLEVVLEEKDVKSYLEKNQDYLFNKSAWFDYYFNLTNHFYSDYSFDKKRSNTILRFLKPLNESLFFGFEYNLSELKYQFNNGSIVSPDFKIILVHKDFKKKTKYIHMSENDIWSLGDLKNPMFLMRGNISNIFASQIVVEKENGIIEIQSLVKKESLDDGRIRLYNSEELGDYLKKFSFYEFMISEAYNKSFLNYIEKSILQAMET